MYWVLKFYQNYAVFKGRSSRQEFIYFTLFIIIIQIIFLTIDIIMGWDSPAHLEGFYYYPSFEISRLVLALPAFGVIVRRLHDINKSGWWSLLVFTFIGLIPIMCWGFFKVGDNNINQYGNPPL